MPAGTPAASMISATASMTSGSLDGGLSTIGLPVAMAGASLCAARFSGKLNGLMAGDRADREATRDADPVLGRGHQVERDELAGHPLGLLGPETEGQRRPVHLDEGVADGLARLERDQPAEFLAPGLDARADLAQDPATLVGGQRAG